MTRSQNVIQARKRGMDLLQTCGIILGLVYLEVVEPCLNAFDHEICFRVTDQFLSLENTRLQESEDRIKQHR